MNAWIRILRPINGVMGIVATIISGFIGVGLSIPVYGLQIAAASLAVFLVTSGGNMINDIVDVDTDRKNHPGRPLVTGEISISQAKAVFIVTFVAALAVSLLLISITAFLLVGLAELFLGVYETKTKKMGLTGNLMISVLVGFIFIFGGIAVDSLGRMLILFGMATLANLSREIIKDIQDMEGDLDRNTLPKRIGRRNAAFISVTAILAAVSISYLPFYLGIFKIFYIFIVTIADALFIVSAITILKDPAMSQQVSKFAMIVGLVSFAVGGVI